ncbi:unnamed protein product [Sphenostylis stenocarpa]|uniref:PTM/DIR17-like Tudor domain-containing protein n=1 Tax=Sphenostylis stenocarpa TaxID=92480 RepID=A0AA86VBA7_9FABA|nr:unnamed protein product [Sphenostylis stenocarpa]
MCQVAIFECCRQLLVLPVITASDQNSTSLLTFTVVASYLPVVTLSVDSACENQETVRFAKQTTPQRVAGASVLFWERIFEMEEDKGIKQESSNSATEVYELPGEPAIVINGVPDIIPGDCSIASRGAPSKVETHVLSGLGEWFEGREVRKWFMGRYYSGRVTDFDKDSRWYRVHYEDGDSEDLDWNELEEVLLPLDVTVPLKSLAEEVVRRGNISDSKSVKNVDHSQNPQIKRKITKGK